MDVTNDVLKSGIFLDGPNTEDLEHWLRFETGASYALTVHSGTQALEILAHWAIYADSDCDPDNPPVAFIPNITYPATLHAFLNAGHKVQIVDTNATGIIKMPDDFDYDRGDVVVPVGLYGALPKLDYNYEYIVDGAQHWMVADEFGYGMAISFDPTKNLSASGNGGAIVTNNQRVFAFAQAYKNNCKYAVDYHINHSGTNSRMSEIDCAHVMVKTHQIHAWQDRRKSIRQYYLRNFEKAPIRCLSRDYPFHMDQKFVIYTNKRDELQAYLKLKGIETKIHYPFTLSELPITQDLIKPDLLSASVMLSRGVLSLPIYPELTDAEVEHITKSVISFFLT